MDDNQFIVEMVSNLAWPIVVVVSVFLLKDKLINFFTGVKSAKYGDNEIQFLIGNKSSKQLPLNNKTLRI